MHFMHVSGKIHCVKLGDRPRVRRNDCALNGHQICPGGTGTAVPPWNCLTLSKPNVETCPRATSKRHTTSFVAVIYDILVR